MAAEPMPDGALRVKDGTPVRVREKKGSKLGKTVFKVQAKTHARPMMVRK